MPKRKRSEPSPSTTAVKSAKVSTTDHRSPPVQRKLCAARLTAGTSALVLALRHAATLERQKHSRRRKTALQKNEDKAVDRLEKEYAVLKGLDLQKVAEGHLKKTLARVKSLNTAEGFPREWRDTPGQTKEKEDAVSLNVKARLFKVQGVRNVVDETIDDLKDIIGTSTKGAQKKGQDSEIHNTKAGSSVSDEEDDESEEGLAGALRAFDVRIAAPSSAEEDSDASLSEQDRPPSVDYSDVESPDLSEESEGDSDSESAIDIPMSNAANSDSFEQFESESDLEKEDVAKTKKTKVPVTETMTKASTFLPSLSHAAYLSGSESEASDLEERLAPKKNRRGQRARQAIWEQKYGEKAKHKQNEDRNKGWDPRRGAVDESARGRRGARNEPPRGRGPEVSGENAMPLGQKKTKRDDGGQLHPSWQAAKAAKEKKMNVQPQGKKIVFD
ncbi:Bud-site selection protein [Aaosphaeria arxii CBS 175.79]|uniref:Bud-site selection protein n=1 Tax=Aaosphaeria arxii CBS 175.79 TaxID=1450172 RepID=A0A6A5X951_9PLEO|nr:Bud-site selection protein [Aaosphaeria arxii CBS 175.79]KAF2009595.1 Bud-site selection protein [Aaosphaeria arxii CBS 175.79]